MGTEGIQERYINPYTDFGFKLLFGTDMNKELLISFLNSLLHEEETIINITYLNTEHLGTQEYDRRAVFDVYCENDKGERILVEMQKGEQQFFKDRSLYYSTFAIREQAPKGVWDYELKAVYTIGILNFRLEGVSPDHYHHEVKLCDLRTRNVFYDKLTFIYLEMPKFYKTENELESMFDKWMFVIKNLAELLDRPKALQERVFTSLFEAAEIAKFSPVKRSEYWESLKNYRDWHSVLKTNIMKSHAKGLAEGLAKGMEEGLAKGMEEGLAKGMEEGLVKGMEEGLVKGMEEGEKKKAIAIAKNLKTLGVATNQIELATGLSADEIDLL